MFAYIEAQEKRNAIFDVQEQCNNGLTAIIKKATQEDNDVNHEECDISKRIEEIQHETDKIITVMENNYANNNIIYTPPNNPIPFKPNEINIEPLSFNTFINNNNLGYPENISYNNIGIYNQQITQLFENHNHHTKSFFSKTNQKQCTIPPTEIVRTSDSNYGFDNTFAPYTDEDIIYQKNYDNKDLFEMFNNHKKEMKTIVDMQTTKITLLQKEINELKSVYQDINRKFYLHNEDLKDLYELKQTKTNKIRKTTPKKAKDLSKLDLPSIPTGTGKKQVKPFVTFEKWEAVDTSKFIKQNTPKPIASPKPMVHQKMNVEVKKGKKRLLESSPTPYENNSNKKSKINY